MIFQFGYYLSTRERCSGMRKKCGLLVGTFSTLAIFELTLAVCLKSLVCVSRRMLLSIMSRRRSAYGKNAAVLSVTRLQKVSSLASRIDHGVGEVTVRPLWYRRMKEEQIDCTHLRHISILPIVPVQDTECSTDGFASSLGDTEG